MTSRRAFPIAPRPEDDELLSSWQGRVACRYDLIHDDLSRWLGVLGDNRRAGFAERDFMPPAEAVQTWAAACRVPEDRVQDLVLCSCPRSLSWYVWGEGRAPAAFQRPICPACLDDDVAAGRDHHLRRSWALVETIVCDRHHRMLEETCPHCLAGSGLRFVFRDAAARLVCVACGRMAGMVHPKLSSGLAERFADWSRQIATAIADQPVTRDRMMQVARLLWKPPRPRTGRRTPFVASIVPDLRLPPSVEMSTDGTEPLATAPFGWRLVTLLGVVKLLDLDDAGQGPDRLPFTIDQMIEWTEERPPLRRKERHAGFAVAPLRPDTEYLELARSILASEDWRAAQGMPTRVRNRTLSTLIDKVLAGTQTPLAMVPARISPRPAAVAPRAPAGAPDPAAI
jgi:hypothetical protein